MDDISPAITARRGLFPVSQNDRGSASSSAYLPSPDQPVEYVFVGTWSFVSGTFAGSFVCGGFGGSSTSQQRAVVFAARGRSGATQPAVVSKTQSMMLISDALSSRPRTFRDRLYNSRGRPDFCAWVRLETRQWTVKCLLWQPLEKGDKGNSLRKGVKERLPALTPPLRDVGPHDLSSCTASLVESPMAQWRAVAPYTPARTTLSYPRRWPVGTASYAASPPTTDHTRVQ